MSSFSYFYNSRRGFILGMLHFEFLTDSAAAKLLQLCPTLCRPIDSSPPGSSVPRILQARILEWVAISFSIQSLRDSVKAVLRGGFIAIQVYLKKQERKQINNLNQLEKEEMKNLRVSRKKEIIKIRAETNEKETKETIAKISKTKSWFFEKIKKIDKPLARLIKKQREKNQINKIRNENGEITTDSTGIQRIIRNYYQQLYANIMDNLEEMDKFLERYNFPKLTQEEIENPNRPITSMEIETVIRNLPANKRQDQTTSQLNSTKNLEKS